MFYGWIRICKNCGDMEYGHPTDGPCPACGQYGIVSGDVWESRIGHIKETWLGKWYKPSTWGNSKKEIISPPPRKRGINE